MIRRLFIPAFCGLAASILLSLLGGVLLRYFLDLIAPENNRELIVNTVSFSLGLVIFTFGAMIAFTYSGKYTSWSVVFYTFLSVILGLLLDLISSTSESFLLMQAAIGLAIAFPLKDKIKEII